MEVPSEMKSVVLPRMILKTIEDLRLVWNSILMITDVSMVWNLEKHNVQPNWYANNAKFVLPAILGPLTYLFFRVYTRPSSVFIRPSATLFAGAVGAFLGIRHEIKQHYIFLMYNYHNFDEEVKLALRSGDARYLRHILASQNQQKAN